MQKLRYVFYIISFSMCILFFSVNIYAYEIGKVLFDNTNIRVSPQNNAPVIYTVKGGDMVHIARDNKDGWYQLEDSFFVRKEYVELVNRNDLENIMIIDTPIIMKTEIGDFPLFYGDKVHIIGYEDTRMKVDFAGLLGYITFSEDTQEVSQLKEDIVNYALNFVGNPYKYGGNSLEEGTDCSGFVQLVYKNFGIDLDRSSTLQYQHNGQAIEWSQVQKGDLIFYGDNGQVSHVALYIGNGQVVHAATEAHGICISNMILDTPIIGIKRL